jgi:hypothetical protein
MVYPLFGRRNPNLAEEVSMENPIEMLDRLHVQPGELELYVGYGSNDEFNLDAQIESFLYRARQKGIEVGVECLPDGAHDVTTALRLMPGIFAWLCPRLAAYSPCSPVTP